MSNVSALDISFLEDEAVFIETLCSDGKGNPLELDYWQRRFIRDKRKKIVLCKSRQVGGSMIGAGKGVVRAHLFVDYRKFFVSYNFNEAKEKIRYAQQFIDSMPEQFHLKKITDAKTEIALEDRKGRVNRLVALTSRQPRGMNGDIDLDEIEMYQNARKMYQAASGLNIRGEGQFTMLSTPRVQDGIFYEAVTNFENRFTEWGCYVIPWWMCRYLCTDVERAVKEAPLMATEERVMKFGSENIRADFLSFTLEGFQQEYEATAVNEATAFMPYDLIATCEVANFGERLENFGESKETEDKVTLLFQHCKEEPSERFWKWVVETTRRGVVQAGVDVGRERDATEIVITNTIDGIKEVRAIVTLKKCPFPTQEKVLTDFLTIVKPHQVYIEKNYNPQLAEVLNARFGSTVIPVWTSNQSKAMIATALKVRFERRTIRIPKDRELVNQIHSIRRTLTGSNNTVYEADSSEHHGDKYWALAFTEGGERFASYEPQVGNVEIDDEPDFLTT